ncbi:hypothetical protein BD311DRAFT_677890, partial [Dichomitus squalens]
FSKNGKGKDGVTHGGVLDAHKSQRASFDSIGWPADMLEWVSTYLMLWSADGVMMKEAAGASMMAVSSATTRSKGLVRRTPGVSGRRGQAIGHGKGLQIDIRRLRGSMQCISTFGRGAARIEFATVHTFLASVSSLPYS